MADSPPPARPGHLTTLAPPPNPATQETLDPLHATPSGGAAPDPKPSPAGPAAPDLPTAVGRFEVRGYLGSGTFGTVYRAHDPHLDREVALKVARDAGSAPDRLQRFRREAQTSAGLRHPHIVPLFEAGEAGGLLYLACAYIPGVTLDDALHERQAAGGFTPRAAAAIAHKLADALAYAHGQGVLHRDVKSANVMLDPAGEPHLLDFGLARRCEDQDRMTQDGAVLGTPAYLAPEVARGERGRWGPAVDQYALGVVLYELLTGQTPYAGPLEVVLALHEVQEPERPARRNRAVPRDLEAVCLKCLEKDPAKRYRDCLALADDLGRWLVGAPTVARPLSTGERIWRWARRNPALAGFYATWLMLVVVIVMAAFAIQRQELQFEQERGRTLAAGMVEALETADIASVPLIVQGLGRLREWADPLLLRRHEAAAPGSRQRLRYALALLPIDPDIPLDIATELLAFAPTAQPEELVVLRDALKDHAEQVKARWLRLTGAGPDERLRLVGLLAGYLPPDERWRPHAAKLSEQLVHLTPLELAGWSPVFHPLRTQLAPTLLDTYAKAQASLKASKAPQELVEVALRFDRAAALLVAQTADQPELLAELLQTADTRHYADFLKSAHAYRPDVTTALRAVLDRKPGGGATDGTIEALAVRQAHAAATLLRFGEPGPAWDLLRYHPEANAEANADPTARSYLIHGLAARGVEPLALIRRYGQEPDASARRALLLALGEYDAAKLPADQRQALADRLLDEYRDHPDAGLHGAIDWLLRQKWGRAADLDRVTAERRGQPADGRHWFVNGQGQTFTVVRGPVEFLQGSPPDEPERNPNGKSEARHPRRIDRSFAIAAREVTVEEYRRFYKDFQIRPQHDPQANGPINDMKWYEAAAYCNKLSEQEGIPKDQWCYEPNAQGQYAAGMQARPGHRALQGYRLPTEAEWEYACRAGAAPARPYGRGTELLGRYAWWAKHGQNRLWPCGLKKPNDFGLFDMLGNAQEWCQDQASDDPAALGDSPLAPISDDWDMIARGGAFSFPSQLLRSASRLWYQASQQLPTMGFRPVRTIR
jgi:formylglycine-generating enzyme required for sulfatase activity